MWTSPDLAERYEVTESPPSSSSTPRARYWPGPAGPARRHSWPSCTSRRRPRPSPRATPSQARRAEQDGDRAGRTRPMIRRSRGRALRDRPRTRSRGRPSSGSRSTARVPSASARARSSTAPPRKSIILTCAHIFKLEGRQPALPRSSPGEITVDLFDGKLQRPAAGRWSTTPTRPYEGKAIDYDFSRDVGLIRIRPGRRLPSSRVVPPTGSRKPGWR